MEVLETAASQSEARAIIRQVVCEIDAARRTDSRINNYWVAFSITLKVEDSAGFTPSLTSLDPLPAAQTSRGVGVAGALVRQRQRTYTQNASFPVNRIPAGYCAHPAAPAAAAAATEAAQPRDSAAKPGAVPPAPPSPAPYAERDDGERTGITSLSGNLRLAEIIGSGLDGVAAMPVPPSGGSKVGSVDGASSFGSTVQFLFRRGVNGSPVVTRAHVRGFGGQANNLFATEMTDTNTLVIAFGNADTAQSLRGEMITQNLELFTR
jgi:hypothetical protein